MAKLVLGLMSGSSLDGLDLALVQFEENLSPSNPDAWKFVATATLPYSEDWIEQLKSSADHKDLKRLGLSFGTYLGQLVNTFLANSSFKPEVIAVHGHTVFHDPAQGISLQLGAASAIAETTGIPCMDDFRTQDIHLGGQGAPLAPTVEHWLFHSYKAFLNIGGIANLSYHQDHQILAFDIGVGNQLLNHLAQEVGKDFDKNGAIAAQGKVNQALLTHCRQTDFFQQLPPKSLSNQWVQSEILPLFNDRSLPLADRMATAVELIAWQLAHACKQIQLNGESLLITGGGAFNTILIQRVQELLASLNMEVVIPDAEIIEFKEALLMALMAYLNISGRNNIFSSATGSKINHCAGNLCLP